MGGLSQWIQQLEFGKLLEMLILVLASLFCITIHETCHGLVAYWLGDDTAKRMGRLSLNPLRHIDIMGLVMMALLRFGWAKAVPVNMRRFRRPKIGMAVTALAGPVSNLLVMVIAVFLKLFSLFGYYQTNYMILYYLVLFFDYVSLLSAGLAVFNLLPIPPLDGFKVLFAFLPDRIYEKAMRYEKFGMLLLMLLLVLGVLDAPLYDLRNGLMDGVYMLAVPLFDCLFAGVL